MYDAAFADGFSYTKVLLLLPVFAALFWLISAVLPSLLLPG